MNRTSSPNSRFRFGLRTLLCLVAALALFLTLVPSVLEWYYSVPLGDAVASFNSRYANDPVGRFEAPVSESEIIAAIQAQLPDLPHANEHVKANLSTIARTRRLPQGAQLHAMNGWILADGTEYTVWWINLAVPTGQNSGYGLRIRENNIPAAKPQDEAMLSRQSIKYY